MVVGVAWARPVRQKYSPLREGAADFGQRPGECARALTEAVKLLTHVLMLAAGVTAAGTAGWGMGGQYGLHMLCAQFKGLSSSTSRLLLSPPHYAPWWHCA